MINRLLHALILSKNQAADEVLAEALRLGGEAEKGPVLAALLRRKTVRGLCGVIAQFETLPPSFQQYILENIGIFHGALREAGRSDEVNLRLAALRLIALGRQGKLAYVLSENLHESDEILSKAATEAMVALAQWIAAETRWLSAGEEPIDANPPKPLAGAAAAAESMSGSASAARDLEPRAAQYSDDAGLDANEVAPAATAATVQPMDAPIPRSRSAPQVYAELMSQRPDIETAIARALDVHRGRHGQELLRAALLLCNWPGSKTLAILHTSKHGGQSPMVRRLQQPPASESVEAFLLGASHGQLRSHFGVVFAHINEAPILDALLRKTHWLKDHQLQLCMHQVTRGAWWGDGELLHDISRRTGEDAACIGEWIGASGVLDVVQDERLGKLLSHGKDSFMARLRLLRVAGRRKRGASVQFLCTLLADPDERISRMAAREIVRRRPANFENMLIPLMTDALPSVRRVISRSIGQAGFEQFWLRYDRLDRPTRKRAGLAMLKLLPDASHRLKRRMAVGPAELRIKALQMAQELGLADDMRDIIMEMCADPNPNLRSKAVSALADVKSVPTDVLIERLVTDTDARVRANAIEVMESWPQARLLPVLAQRARSLNSRERANAIKSLHRMKVGAASEQLVLMLQDPRPEHRISGLWALRQMGLWQLLNEVGRLAKEDSNLKVRRYALNVLKNVAELAREKEKQGAA
ncbi:MAG TPA: HEAT repeat domain-containing protein [Tepidisphaeraceae bacterium]|nr:HEAT repeat domain-containing protein [Tepidisphaeraceae bacterium]